MTGNTPLTIRRLGPADAALMDGMLDVLEEAFEDHESYGTARPSAAYLQRLLSTETFIALVAMKGNQVVGGLAAYELRKFEQERSEVYIYDLGVAAAHRREGIATALIDDVRRIAARQGAWVVFVQADVGDDPAIELYSKLGTREEVLHFDIAVR